MSDMNQCERTPELVSYVYNEADDNARRSFTQHLNACAPCRAELAAFGDVRGAVRDWHTELLNHAPALTLPALLPAYGNGQAAHAPTAIVAPRRSALAALREFFTLTPVWLRAGMVAASLVVCALAVLAVVNAEFHWDGHGVAFNTHLRGRMNTKQPVAPPQATQQVATAVNESQSKQADIDKLTAERDAAQRDLVAIRARLDATQQQVNVLNASLSNSKATYRQMLAGMRGPRGSQAGGAARNRLTNGPLVAENNDEDGLRLSDLLNEVNAGRDVPQINPDKR